MVLMIGIFFRLVECLEPGLKYHGLLCHSPYL